jgi:hypothetical protein
LTLNALFSLLKSRWRPSTDSRKVPAISNSEAAETLVYPQLEIRFTCFPHFKVLHVYPPLRGFDSLRRRSSARRCEVLYYWAPHSNPSNGPLSPIHVSTAVCVPPHRDDYNTVYDSPALLVITRAAVLRVLTMLPA